MPLTPILVIAGMSFGVGFFLGIRVIEKLLDSE